MDRNLIATRLKSIAEQMEQVAEHAQSEVQDYDLLCSVGALAARLDILLKYIDKNTSKPS
jgi:hypothetical protein